MSAQVTQQAQSLAQKIIARAAGKASVGVGDIVTCKVDLAMFHDSSGPRRLKPMLDELGAQIWDKSKVVLVMDHYVPERDDAARKIVRIAREWAAEQCLPHVYDSQGICHVVLPQHGHIQPGMFCVGGDSHSPTGGAFGAYMFGIGIGAYASWLSGTAVGAFAGGGALDGWPAISAGLGFMLPALFLALLLSILSRRQLPVIAVAGVVTVAATLAISGTSGILLGMLAGAITGVLRR